MSERETMDIVERLRQISRTPGMEQPDTAREAADEIERLRRGLFLALSQAGCRLDEMEPEIAAFNTAALTPPDTSA